MTGCIYAEEHIEKLEHDLWKAFYQSTTSNGMIEVMRKEKSATAPYDALRESLVCLVGIAHTCSQWLQRLRCDP